MWLERQVIKIIIIIATVNASIFQNPNFLEVTVQNNAVLTCQFTGNPPPTITWEREGSDPLPEESRLFITETNLIADDSIIIYTVTYYSVTILLAY